ncbi:MAG: hypothetical protein V2J24_10490 [Pseudomonadales bacterium]|jgi:hypothetical protein|nr:hypothetical protein [Pseudomonadales bacterium]
MRFLFGICSGAVLLLVLAGEGADSGAGGTFAGGVERAVPWLAERVRSLEPPRAEPAAAVQAPAEPAPRRSEGEAPLRDDPEAQPGGVAALWPDDAPLPEAFGDAYAWWARDGEEAVPAPGREPVDVPAPLAPAAPEQAPPASAGAPTVAAEDAQAVAAVDPVTPRTASVWIPFHSERSAAGFAQRLARALEHPFDVRREGPGRYQVVFPYDDADRRDEVLARVAMLTGTQQ